MFCARGPFVESPVLAPETFRARKGIFSSSVSKNGEVYTPDTFYMTTSVISYKVRDFAMAFRVRKHFRTFEKRAPGVRFLRGPKSFRTCKVPESRGLPSVLILKTKYTNVNRNLKYTCLRNLSILECLHKLS